MAKNKSQDPKSNKWQEFAEQQVDIDTDDAKRLFEDEQASGETTPDLKESNKPQSGLTYPSHEELEQELNALEMRIAEYKDAAIRAKAEAENTKRRAERDVQNAHKYGNEKILTDMLPVVDSLVRGLEGQEPTDPAAKALREGMQLTLNLFEKTLEKHGIAIIDPVKGDVFNPELHEAMSMQADPDAQSNTVLQVLQKGYELNGRVIRAAMVIVAS